MKYLFLIICFTWFAQLSLCQQVKIELAINGNECSACNVHVSRLVDMYKQADNECIFKITTSTKSGRDFYESVLDSEIPIVVNSSLKELYPRYSGLSLIQIKVLGVPIFENTLKSLELKDYRLINSVLNDRLPSAINSYSDTLFYNDEFDVVFDEQFTVLSNSNIDRIGVIANHKYRYILKSVDSLAWENYINNKQYISSYQETQALLSKNYIKNAKIKFPFIQGNALYFYRDVFYKDKTGLHVKRFFEKMNLDNTDVQTIKEIFHDDDVYFDESGYFLLGKNPRRIGANSYIGIIKDYVSGNNTSFHNYIGIFMVSGGDSIEIIDKVSLDKKIYNNSRYKNILSYSTPFDLNILNINGLKVVSNSNIDSFLVETNHRMLSLKEFLSINYDMDFGFAERGFKDVHRVNGKTFILTYEFDDEYLLNVLISVLEDNNDSVLSQFKILWPMSLNSIQFVGNALKCVYKDDTSDKLIEMQFDLNSF